MIDEFIGKTLAGKYKIEEILRENELGNVYSGRHLLMESPVAIKILAPALAVDESIVESFSIEARTISRLSHPNILNVTDFGKDDDGTVFIVMEDAVGETLKEAVEREGAFSVERAVRVARQISAALSSAHASLLVHGHLTSENILLTKMANDSELVKVFNLGSFDSVRREEYEDQEALNDLAYMSPEQCSGESEADERSDIYSLGIMFFEMLAGEVPFTADNPTELMLKHAEVPPPPFAAFRDDIPEDIEPIVIRALAKNPDMRYQTASAFAEDLSEAARIDGDEASIVAPHMGAVPPVAVNNNIWKTAFIVLAGVSLLAFGLIYFTNVKRTDPTTVQQIDENGQPVQPLNAATGINEQYLPVSNYPGNSLDPNDPLTRPDVGGGDGGGDGYDPWSRPGTPPGGYPSYQPPLYGGDMVTIPGDSRSPFNQDEPLYDANGKRIYLIPKESPKASPSPKTDSTDANGVTKTDPTTKTTPKPDDKGKPKVDPKATKKPGVKPEKPVDKKPVEKPKKTSPPAKKDPKAKSGVERDT